MSEQNSIPMIHAHGIGMKAVIGKQGWDALTRAGEIAEPPSIAVNITYEGRTYTGVAYRDEAKLKELLAAALYTDGEHHKQWYLWEIATALGIDLTNKWDEGYPEPDRGIAP